MNSDWNHLESDGIRLESHKIIWNQTGIRWKQMESDWNHLESDGIRLESDWNQMETE